MFALGEVYMQLTHPIRPLTCASILLCLLTVGCGRESGSPSSRHESESQDVKGSTSRKDSKNSKTGGGSSDTSAKTSDWKTDPSQVPRLGEEVAIGNYRIRPPKGYKLDDFSTDPKTLEPGGKFNFVPATAPKYWPRIALQTKVLDQFDSAMANEKLLAGAADQEQAYRQIKADFTKTTPERGNLSGLPAWRCRFGGTEEITDKDKLHGVYYLVRDGNVAIYTYFGAVEPNHEATLKMLEAAVLSFRKP
jgi:hypothetical protein